MTKKTTRKRSPRPSRMTAREKALAARVTLIERYLRSVDRRWKQLL